MIFFERREQSSFSSSSSEFLFPIWIVEVFFYAYFYVYLYSTAKKTVERIVFRINQLLRSVCRTNLFKAFFFSFIISESISDSTKRLFEGKIVYFFHVQCWAKRRSSIKLTKCYKIYVFSNKKIYPFHMPKNSNAHSLPHTHMLNFSISNQFNINSILILIKLNAKQFLKTVQSIFHRYHHTTVGLKSLCLRTFYVYNWFFLVAKWNKLEKKRRKSSHRTQMYIFHSAAFFSFLEVTW